MTKPTTKKNMDFDDFDNQGTDNKKEPEPKQEKLPIEWVCTKKCYCSADGTVLRMRIWEVGEPHWGIKPPSTHFIPRAEYDSGSGGKSEWFTKIQRYGGQLTERIKILEIPALKAYATQLEREFLRKQASV